MNHPCMGHTWLTIHRLLTLGHIPSRISKISLLAIVGSNIPLTPKMEFFATVDG